MPLNTVAVFHAAQAEMMLKRDSTRNAPPKPKPKGEKQHASTNIPPEHMVSPDLPHVLYSTIRVMYVVLLPSLLTL